MEAEKQFIDLVVHVFTLQWAIWAIPLSLLLSLFTKKVVSGLMIAFLAVAIHHVGPLALPMLEAGGDISGLPAAIQAMIPKLEPLSVLAEYVAYAFLIVVFSLTRQDMFRPGVADTT